MRKGCRLDRRVPPLIGLALLAPPAAQGRDFITSTSWYETANDSRESPIGFDPATRTFHADAESAAYGPQGPAGPGATRGSVRASWSGGARATGRIASYVETRDADNYPDVPFLQRQSGSSVEAEIVAQYVVADATPSDGPVPVTLDLSFTGRMVASGAAGDPAPWPSMVRAFGTGWARVGVRPVGRNEGRALLDAYSGVDDGGDWDGLLDEVEDEETGAAGGTFLLHAGGTYAFDARPGETILVYLSSRLDSAVNDASGGHVVGDIASEDGFGGRFSLSSTDPGVSFILVPEPGACAAVVLVGAGVLRRRRRPSRDPDAG